MIINLYAILKRKVKYLTIILRSSVRLEETTALFGKGFYTEWTHPYNTGDVADIIKNLSSKKSHGHDNISTKICGVSTYAELV